VIGNSGSYPDRRTKSKPPRQSSRISAYIIHRKDRRGSLSDQPTRLWANRRVDRVANQERASLPSETGSATDALEVANRKKYSPQALRTRHEVRAAVVSPSHGKAGITDHAWSLDELLATEDQQLAA
jgi:hypothetical protein